MSALKQMGEIIEVLRRTHEEAVAMYAEVLANLTPAERKSLISIYEKLNRDYDSRGDK